jgi:hypothetical protein
LGLVEWIVIILGVVVVAVLLVLLTRRMREQRVRQRFGPEYERTVAETGSQREAVSALQEREKRRKQLDVRPLEPAAAQRFAESWQDKQALFVDHPGDAIRGADELIAQVMKERGYPFEDFDQRAEDVSVDHPNVVDNYRRAHAIAQANAKGDATTEELRQAMVHYRALFEELLEGGTGSTRR